MVFLYPLLYKEVSMGSLTKATLNAARFVSGWVQLQYYFIITSCGVSPSPGVAATIRAFMF
jgi:hypothetical protein